MTTIEMIWGPGALQEVLQPFTDPIIRAIEEETRNYYLRVLSKMYGPAQMDNSRWLPEHYKK